MGIKLVTWNDDQAKKEILKRLKNAQDSRIRHEDFWTRNEGSVYNTRAGLGMSPLSESLGINFSTGMPPVSGSDAESQTSYTFKNIRFMHAQMSSNPPTVVMKPQTSDQDDYRKADAADRVMKYSLRHYKMQERMDSLCLQTLLYGTGVLKTVWDSGKGAVIGFDESTEELQLEGDISVTIPFVWNIFLDPDAKSADELKWVIERIYMDYDEACARWPGKEDILKKARIEKDSTRFSGNATTGRDSQLEQDRYNSVELLEYWETGLPTNGYLGKYCITTKDGDILESPRPNPFRFRKAGAVSKIENDPNPALTDDIKEEMIRKLPEQASLPFHILTDVDVPNSVWGKSTVEWAAQLQGNLNSIDSSRMDNLKASAVNRLVIPESAELADDSISNSPWDIIKISGNQPPYHMNPATPYPDLTPTRVDTIQGINDVMGVNESMFGQQSREQAAAAMQYATNQGNMIRRRLFNKYVLVTESIYSAILNLFRKHWTTKRMIHVLGKEKALEAIDLKGADIDGGYDVVGEYGTTLSLDPVTRKQEIMTLQPIFEKAGIPVRTSLRMMKLADLDDMYDKLDLAASRQKEIFDLMIATNTYIAPKKYRDHENMIAWAYDYFMTSEFEMLPENVQILCETHIEDRVQLAAQEKAGVAATPAPATPAAPGMQPAPAAPAAPVPQSVEPSPSAEQLPPVGV